MSEGPKIPLRKAEAIADRFLQFVSPHCIKASVAGSVRRKCVEVGDIEIVVVARDEFSLEKLFPEGFKGMVVNGPRLKRFKYPDEGLQIELYITELYDYGRILAIRTGSSAFSHIKLATTWNRMGWAGTPDGLRRRKECDHKGTAWKIKPEFKISPTTPPVFDTEEAFFEFLGIPWISPEQRSWVSKYEKINYSI